MLPLSAFAFKLALAKERVPLFTWRVTSNPEAITSTELVSFARIG